MHPDRDIDETFLEVIATARNLNARRTLVGEWANWLNGKTHDTAARLRIDYWREEAIQST